VVDLQNEKGTEKYKLYTSIKRYWGQTNEPFDPSLTLDITKVTPKFQDNFGGNPITSLDLSNDNTKFVYFAYPDKLADLTTFKYNGTEYLSSFSKSVVDLQNEKGTEKYKLYTSIKRYWGTIDQPFDPATTLDITKVTPKYQDNLGGNKITNLDIANDNSKFLFFAYPNNLADLTSFIYNGSESIRSFKKSIIDINNGRGTEKYKVYTSLKRYWGLTNSPFDDAKTLDVKTLNQAETFQDNSGGTNYLNLNIDIKDLKHVYFAFPDIIGNADLKTITFDGGFNQIGAFAKSYVNIQNGGDVQRYVVYTSKYPYEPDDKVSPILQITNWEFK
jgi:hypothetical protein